VYCVPVLLMRVPQLVREDEGAVTDLVNTGINLNDKIRQGLGEVKLGDVKDFTLKVKIQFGSTLLKPTSSACRFSDC
jgi:hypothetical protein